MYETRPADDCIDSRLASIHTPTRIASQKFRRLVYSRALTSSPGLFFTTTRPTPALLVQLSLLYQDVRSHNW